MRISIVTMLCAALLIVTAPAAEAQTDKQKAGKLFRVGNKLYARGNAKGALEKFLRARKLFPSYKLDLNIATCLYDMGRHAEAARELERFLDKAEKAPPATVKAANLKLSKLRRSLSSIKLTSNEDGATILVDGKEVGRTPLRRRIYLRPGLHQLKLMKEGFAFHNKEVELKIDEHREMAVTMKKKDAMVKVVKVPVPAPRPAPATRPVKAKVAAAAGNPDRDQVEAEAKDDPDPLDQENRWGLFVNVLLGPYWASYGDYAGEFTAALEVGGDIGFLWRLNRRLGIHAHASVLYDALVYSRGKDEYQLGFLNLFFGGGARLYFWKLWAELRLAAGPALLLGAEENVFPLKPGTLEGTPVGFAVRTSLGLGWTFYKGLTVSVHPVGIEYMPAIDSFLPEITGIFRYQLGVAVGWQM